MSSSPANARLTPELVAELRTHLLECRAAGGASHNEALAIDRWIAERAPGLTPAAARKAAYGRGSWLGVPGPLDPPRAWRIGAGLPARADNRRGLRYAPQPGKRSMSAGTAREARARMLAGATARQIARELGLGVGTVRALRYGLTYREEGARPDAPSTPLGRALVATASATPRGSRALARERTAVLRARAAYAVEGLASDPRMDERERLAREGLAARLDLAARRILA